VVHSEDAKALNTPVCERLGVRFPVVQAPIGSSATPELAAAVANAGALGMLGLTWTEPAGVVRLVRRTREATDGAFGVNFGLAFPIRAQLRAALDEDVRIISTFWGDPEPVRDLIAGSGAIHLHTVRSPQEARSAVQVGVDIVVAQGWEAGGHVWGEVASLPLIPAVVDAVTPVPVIAAGGIADGRGLAAALMLGAQAVWVGTRFLTAEEASTHPSYRARVAAAEVTDTTHTMCFDGGWPDAPHRVLRNATLQAWEEAGRPSSPMRPGEGAVVAQDERGRRFLRYDDVMPLADLEGDLDEMALYAGQSAGLVHQVQPAADIVGDLISGALVQLRRWSPDQPS
jgi:NAD(P)H-dependent flavin oxidoreductase YrpB (nitropropane dioxygenase family)